MALTIWKRLWGGPCDGRSFPFTEAEPFLPVSRDRLDAPCKDYRVGTALHDWWGELVGHYHISEYSGRAEFLDLPPKVKGLYTRWDPQADGEDGN